MTDIQAKRKTVDTLVRYYTKRWEHNQVVDLYRVSGGLTEFWSYANLVWATSTRPFVFLVSRSISAVTAEEAKAIQRERALRDMAHIEAWLKHNP